MTPDADIASGVLISLSVLSLLAAIPHLINTSPSILDSFIWWKGSVPLNSSVSLSRSRNIVAASLIVPFLMIAAGYDLMDIGPDISLISKTGLYFLIFAAFMLLRALMRLFKSEKISRKDWNCVHSVERNFFTGMVILELVTLLVSYLFKLDHITAKECILWEICAVFCLFLIRKGQILFHIRNKFIDILYLCTLEILPLGLLIVSEIFL